MCVTCGGESPGVSGAADAKRTLRRHHVKGLEINSETYRRSGFRSRFGHRFLLDLRFRLGRLRCRLRCFSSQTFMLRRKKDMSHSGYTNNFLFAHLSSHCLKNESCGRSSICGVALHSRTNSFSWASLVGSILELFDARE